MVFSSIVFLSIFLPAFLAAYYASGKANAVVLVASLVFYGWGGPEYLPLLAFYIVWNYGFGLAIGRAPAASRARRGLLALGLAGNLAGLVGFKYLGFLVEQFDWAAPALGLPALPALRLVLPLGISFFSFQAMSYLIDVHRAEVRAEPSLLAFATYKAMFPQLVAGPIVRYRQVAAELKAREVDLERFGFGILAFVVGLAQKSLIANPLARPADQIFALSPGELAGPVAWLGVACYTAQIYFDFCGYSNMAIGLGHMMGFTLPPNFDRPYVAQSASEFWRRWHMSLSGWFRDYLYVPLGGNRLGPARTYVNLAIVFLLCGLWHGAAWTFVLWGAFWGAFLIAERAFLGDALARLWRPLRHAYLLAAVMVGWVLFRSDTPAHAGAMLRAMAGLGTADAAADPLARYFTPSLAVTLGLAALLSALPSTPGRLPRPDSSRASGAAGALAFWASRAAVLLLGFASILSIAGGTYNPFIYFRF